MEKTIIKVPTTIQVGGHQYSISFSNKLEDSRDYGTVNHRTLTIEINPVRPDSQRFEALLHEFLHIFNRVYGHNNLAEEEISHMSEGFLQVLTQLGIVLDWEGVETR